MELNRREMLRLTTGMVAGTAWADWAPEIRNPRATSGDTAIEPEWAERLTITVGPDKADVAGEGDKAIQAAVDYVKRLGGGTVKMLPGTYRLRNAVYLPSGIRLCGSGAETVLIKEASVETTLAADSDWFDQEITLANAEGFQVGDGVCLQTANPDHGGWVVVKRTLVARNGNRFKLDRALRDNFWTLKTPTVSTLFPILTAEEATDIAIEDLVLDGNKELNAELNGNYAGCIWMQDCSRIAVRGVTARNYNGDGISWQICHDVLVENCHSHDNTGLGLHPGSGSQRPVIRNNTLERNSIGIFFCWGVKYGLAEKNTIRDSADCGISIGHRDDNNVIRDNDILNSGKVGILFRPERGEGFTARGNRLENNRIIDSGPEDAAAIDVQGVTAANTIARNEIRETRGPASRVGIRLGKETGPMELAGNLIDGFAKSIEDLHDRQPDAGR